MLIIYLHIYWVINNAVNYGFIELLQDKRAVERMNIEKAYHPFITGAHNKLVGEVMQETGARINVPPPSVNKTEIVITGEKEQVALAMVMVKKIYEEKVSNDQ